MVSRARQSIEHAEMRSFAISFCMNLEMESIGRDDGPVESLRHSGLIISVSELRECL
jgi:hypothetical protein